MLFLLMVETSSEATDSLQTMLPYTGPSDVDADVLDAYVRKVKEEQPDAVNFPADTIYASVLSIGEGEPEIVFYTDVYFGK